MPNIYFYIESQGLILKTIYFLYLEVMENVVLNADVRAKDEKVSYLRTQKMVPCVVYGKNQEPISMKIDNSSLLRAYRNAGESTIINLKVGKKDLEVLVHAVQREPVTGDFLHMDFYAVTRGEKVHTKIVLNFVGTAPAAKEGAIIDEITKELDVKCLPRNLVEHFDVDLSLLKEVGDAIRLSDLGLDSEKYEIHEGEDTVIVTAAKPKVVEEESLDDPVTGADEEPEDKSA